MKLPNRPSVICSIVLIAAFVWVGFVCSISFMEAWVKFRAPNVSLSAGLSIGKLVFSALNKVEWILAGIIASLAMLDHEKPKLAKSIFLHVPIIILVVQTAWLLPFLNERAEKIIRGMEVFSSSIHWIYMFLELMKLASLFTLGLSVIHRLIRFRERT